MDKQLLIEAENEIRSLRRQNEILTAKVEVMDLFACVLHTSPAERNRGAAPDVAWKLMDKIAEINAKEKLNEMARNLSEAAPKKKGAKK